MGRVLQLASFSLAEVTYTAGDIGYQVQESVRKATYTVQAKSENVSGVQLPAFEAVRGQGGSGTSLHLIISVPLRFMGDVYGGRQTNRREC
jgi:V-type H+-transporting ATPase subunit D